MASSLVWVLPGPPRAAAAVTDRRAAGGRPVAEATAVSELDEAGLVEACLAGRPGAFDVIVERHRRPVYQLCYRFVGNHEDASDLSQDVFLRAYRGLGKFRGGSSLSTWLDRKSTRLNSSHRMPSRMPSSA